MNIRRILWIVAPLVSVTCYSAPEWPARLEMLDDGFVKSTLYEPSVKLKNIVNSITIRNEENEKVPIETATLVKSEDFQKNDIVTSKNVAESSVSVEKVLPVEQNKEIKQPETKQPETPEKEKNHDLLNLKPKFIMTVGDSLMSEVSQGLRSELDKDVKIKDIHKSSTGLTNIDYYDWPSVAYTNVKQYQPDTVILHMGGNDGQDMKVGKLFVHIDDPLWKETYMQRTELLISKIKQANPSVNIVWLGLPEMRDAKFARKMNIIRSAQYEVCNKLNIKYIDGKDALGKEYKKQGVFDGKMQSWRRTDGIHYTREGGTVMAHTLKEDLKW